MSIGRLQLQHLIRNYERQRGKLDSAFLLQHGKRLLERFNNVSKGQGVLVFVAVADVAVQTFGKERLKKMKASAFMFFNCCQRAGETCTSKATPIMIWRKERYRPAVDPTEALHRPDNL